MNADCKGALAALNQSYKSFVHQGNRLSKQAVKEILEYAISKGYEHTGQLKDAEINSILVKGTTIEQWERYEKESADFETRMRSIEPPKDEMPSLWNEWLKSYSMDAPNKPGYYRANND